MSIHSHVMVGSIVLLPIGKLSGEDESEADTHFTDWVPLATLSNNQQIL